MCGTIPNSGNELTFCGYALDAYESGDCETPIKIAATGEIITCPFCREQIRKIKSIKHWKSNY